MLFCKTALVKSSEPADDAFAFCAEAAEWQQEVVGSELEILEGPDSN